MTGESAERNEPNNNNLTSDRLREFVQTTNWNLIVAGFFSTVHFAWLVRTILPRNTSFKRESTITVLQDVFNSLGFLGKEEEGLVSDYPVFILSLLQFLMSCLLLWGVHSKSLRRIDQWLLFTVWSAFLNSLNLMKDLSTVTDSFTGFRLVCRATTFYIFTAIYIWEFYDFRSLLLVSGGVSLREFRSSVCCCVGNKDCLKICASFHVALFSIIMFACYTSTFINQDSEETWRTWFVIIGSIIGLTVSILLFPANSKDNQRGIEVWLCFEIGLCFLWYGLLARSITEMDHDHMAAGEVISLYFCMSPLIAMIWISHVRLQEIKYAPPATVYSFMGGGNSVIIPLHQVTVNVTT